MSRSSSQHFYPPQTPTSPTSPSKSKEKNPIASLWKKVARPKTPKDKDSKDTHKDLIVRADLVSRADSFEERSIISKRHGLEEEDEDADIPI
jgi:hypothetical protein